MKFFRRLAEELQEGAVVATVIKTKGSTPRENGAKMLVCSDGKTFGTIGGGAGEAKVIREAENIFNSGGNRLVEIDLTRLEAEGICGGKMQVWLESWQGKEARHLVGEILKKLENGTPVTLATPLTATGFSYLFEEKRTPPRHVFLEQINPPPVLLIVGAGHVGIELAKIAGLLDFEIIVEDDRPEWANERNFSENVEISTQPLKEILARFSNYPEFHAALVTRGFEHDLKALKALLESEISSRYTGLIGSEKRIRQVFDELEQSGIDKETLAAIHAPIGLKIGALTPAEIAVSIAAELILVRRGGKIS